VKDKSPEDGLEVLGYSEKWVHPDFNKNGVRVCFQNNDEWQSAKWDNDQDHWHTHAEWCCENGNNFNPTHWILKPESPRQSYQDKVVPDGMKLIVIEKTK